MFDCEFAMRCSMEFGISMLTEREYSDAEITEPAPTPVHTAAAPRGDVAKPNPPRTPTPETILFFTIQRLSRRLHKHETI